MARLPGIRIRSLGWRPSPQESHLVFYLLPSLYTSCSADRCLWGVPTLPMPLLSKSPVEGVGMAAVVYRLWVSRDVKICPEPRYWPDPAGGVRCQPPSWYRFTSSVKVQCLPLLPFITPPPQKSTRWGQAASGVGWVQRYQAAWEGHVKAKIKKTGQKKNG